MKIRLATALAVAGFCGACSGGPPYPSGWQPVTGASPATQWSTGTGDSLQTYSYEKHAFTGSLQELASQQVLALLKENKGGHFEGGDTFAPCPSQASLQTETLPGGRAMVRGLSVQSGQAVIVTYVRPPHAAMDPEVGQAFAKALCPGL